LQYMIYVNRGEEAVEDYVNGEPDIYHVILSVEGGGIDAFFDGHGSCGDSEVLSVLAEYGLNFKTVTILKLPIGDRVESFIRSNTNYDSGAINEHGILELLQNEYKKVNEEGTLDELV